MNYNSLLLEKVRAEECKRSLFEFLVEFWDVVIQNECVFNWHIKYLCDEIQTVLQWVIDGKKKEYDLIINISPGTTKSTIISRVAPAWLWANDDSKTIISSTIDGKNASEFATSSRDIIESEKFKKYYPHVKIRRDVSAKTFYQSENGGKRYSFTTRGSKTGKHADVLIDDDPMDYTAANSPDSARRCIEGFKELQTRKKDKDKVPYILVMQRLSSRDTTVHAMKALGKVKHICLPAENIHNNVKPAELADKYIDGLMDPVRLSRDTLEAEKKGLNDDSMPISDIAFNIQYNQVTQSVQGLMYPNMQMVDELPQASQRFRFSFTDVADRGDDYFCTWFLELNDHGMYVIDAIYTQEPSNITSKLYKEKAIIHATMINQMEVNNQGSVYVTMMTDMGVQVNGYYSSGNKEERIMAWSQFVGFLKFLKPNTQPYHTSQYASAIAHVKSYPKQGKADDRHDDAEDALTELLRYMYTNYRNNFQKNMQNVLQN